MLSTLFSYSPLWRVVPEVVEGSTFQYPVKILVGVLEASEVSQSRGVVSGVLEDVHSPCPTAHEVSVASAGDVTPAVVFELCQWLFVDTDACIAVHEPDIAVAGCIAGLNASAMK